MRAVVIYESLTGNTRRASRLMAEEFQRAGVEAMACPITDIDFQALALADLVVIGTWTDGIFVVGQRPGRAARLKKMPVLDRKKAVVFCTYAIDPGKTLQKLSSIVAERGADVQGGMAIRRDRIEEGARDFVDRVLATTTAA